MEKDLLVIVPSRARVANVARLCTAFLPPTRAQLVVCQDDDDIPYRLPEDVLHVVGPRASFVGWLNRIAADDSYQYPFVGAFGDDHFPRTPGWADKICAALEEMGPGSMAYANDLFQQERLSTTIFMTSDVPKALGYFAPPGFRQYCDPSWFAMGKGAGCLRYLPDVVVEHLHPAANKANQDQTYRDSFRFYQADMAYFAQYLVDQEADDVAKLKALRGS